MSTQCDTFRRGVGKIILWRSHAAPFHRRFAAVYDPQAMVRLFPMYVMPVETLLDLEGGRLPKHEDINDKLARPGRHGTMCIHQPDMAVTEPSR